ncbi:IS1 encoded protein, partial [Escherichia coli]
FIGCYFGENTFSEYQPAVN